MFLEWAITESLTVITLARIYDTVLRRTIIQKVAGESYNVTNGN